MPLRDHFHSPLDDRASWDGFHGQWPAMMTLTLSRLLPDGYAAAPHVHLGTTIEVDVAAFRNGPRKLDDESTPYGGAATAVWAPPKPTWTIATESPDVDEYEVRIYDTRRSRRLVAAVEIVSPSNKDRLEHRRAFAIKCAAMLQEGVGVAIVDLVTTRSFNLYRDVIGMFGESDPSLGDPPPSLYAVSSRWTRNANKGILRAWTSPLALGQPLPTLPLWLDEDVAVPLDLEASYEETSRILRLT